MTTITETSTIDLSTPDKIKAYLKQAVTEYYESMIGVEDVDVKVSQLRDNQSMDAAFNGRTWVITVSYKDEYHKALVYQMVAIPSPKSMTRTEEQRIAFIDSVVEDLYESRKYLSHDLYSIVYQ